MPFVDEPDPRPVAEAVPLEAVTEGAFVVDNLVLSRGGQRILRGVSAEFVAGEVSVIVGGNGSGKSTLLLAMGGRLPFSAGTLRCGGGSIAKGRRSVLRESVGWLGHELGLYADLTVAENLELFAGLAAVATSKRRVDEPDPLGVVPLEQRRVRDLSRGQRQRVALARVLLADPHVLLLDEPTTGLDVRATARLAELLTGIASSGRCVVVVTHDTEFTRALRSGVAPIAVWAMRGGALHRSSSDDDKATDGFT